MPSVTGSVSWPRSLPEFIQKVTKGFKALCNGQRLVAGVLIRETMEPLHQFQSPQ